MEKEKMMIEMLQNLTTSMETFKAEMKQGMIEMKVELKADIAEVKAGLKADIAEVKAEVAELKQRFDNLGEMFEHTVQLQQASNANVQETLDFHKHKIATLEQDIYTMKHKQ